MNYFHYRSIGTRIARLCLLSTLALAAFKVNAQSGIIVTVYCFPIGCEDGTDGPVGCLEVSEIAACSPGSVNSAPTVGASATWNCETDYDGNTVASQYDAETLSASAVIINDLNDDLECAPTELSDCDGNTTGGEECYWGC
jgi:hypothetical protein